MRPPSGFGAITPMMSQSDPQQMMLFWGGFGAVTLVSAAIQRLLGFGFALVALSVLPYMMDVREANIITSLAAVPPLVIIFLTHRHGIHRRALHAVLIGAVTGLVPGLFLFSAVDGSWLTRGTGAVVLLITIDMLRGRLPDPDGQPSLAWGVFSGAVSGILAGAVGVPGPAGGRVRCPPVLESAGVSCFHGGVLSRAGDGEVNCSAADGVHRWTRGDGDRDLASVRRRRVCAGDCRVGPRRSGPFPSLRPHRADDQCCRHADPRIAANLPPCSRIG